MTDQASRSMSKAKKTTVIRISPVEWPQPHLAPSQKARHDSPTAKQHTPVRPMLIGLEQIERQESA
eukprot:SAG31_NODE_6177_length_2136_cov_1.305351_2_plen_66_part_00